MDEATIRLPNNYPEVFGEKEEIEFTVKIDKDKNLLTFIIEGRIGHEHALSAISHQLFT